MIRGLGRFGYRLQSPGTYGLIGANVAVWGLYCNAPEARSRQWQWFGTPASPARSSSWLPSRDFWEKSFFASYSAVVQGRRFETLPLCTFMHADGQHLLFNMVSLFFIGRTLEQFLGLGRFLAFYLCSSTAAAAAQIGACGPRESYTKVIGASGGVYALLAYTTCLMPHQTVLLYMIVPVPMWLLMGGLVAADMFWLRPGEGRTGHLTGAACGATYYLLRFRSFRF